MLDIRNEDLHQVYFILKTNSSAQAHFCNAAVTCDLWDLRVELENINMIYNDIYSSAPFVNICNLSRNDLITLVDTFVGA